MSMGVYIKGMEMPTNCNECRFFVDAWCYALEVDDWRNAYNKPPDGERLDSCPLVPVPPHGDLIDRDALKENCMKEDGFLAELLFRKISNAPTIIPAEEGET